MHSVQPRSSHRRVRRYLTCFARNPATALKGYTSKLENYDGLTSVTSFGFRGEALSSLCQLADVVITTATENEAPIGTVLTFDKRGQLLASSSKAARSVSKTEWYLFFLRDPAYMVMKLIHGMKCDLRREALL